MRVHSKRSAFAIHLQRRSATCDLAVRPFVQRRLSGENGAAALKHAISVGVSDIPENVSGSEVALRFGDLRYTSVMSLRRKALYSFLSLAALLASPSTRAQSAETDVDLELVLAVDASRSMAPYEQKIQRDGYVAAFGRKEVIDAIDEGVHGRVAIIYVEWAGSTLQRIIVPWTLVDSPESAAKFAAKLDQPIPPTQSRTSISGAIDFSSALFDNNGFKGTRTVIDISGDGVNNIGRPVTEARYQALAKGITINGLPVMINDDLSADWAVDLDIYYSNCVIGGPGAFMIPVISWDQFPEVVRRKLVLELAGDVPITHETDRSIFHKADKRPSEELPVVLTQNKSENDCLSGERIWRQRMQNR